MTDRLLETLAAIAATAADTVERTDELVHLLRRIGVDVDADDLAGGFPTAAGIAALATSAAELLDGVADGIDPADVTLGAQLAGDIAAVLDDLASADLDFPGAPDVDWGEVAALLPQVLLFDAIEDAAPWMLATLLLLGVVVEQIHEIDGVTYRSAAVDTKGLTDLVARPVDHYRSMFVDGSSVDVARCARVLELLFGGDLVVGRHTPSTEWITTFLGNRLDAPATGDDPRAVTVLRARDVSWPRPVRAIGASVGPARPGNEPEADATALGIVLDGLGSGPVSAPVADGVTLTITADAPSPGLIVAADGTVEAVAAVTGDDVVRVEVSGTRSDGWTLLGREGATRLWVSAFDLGLAAGGAPLDLSADLAVHGLAVDLGGEEADSFISQLLGSFTVSVDLDVALSGRGGLVIGGSAQLTVVIPLSLRLGPLELDDLTITVAPEVDGVDLTLTTGVGADLGPFSFVVDGIGAVVSARSGAVSLGFDPPEGIGVGVDLGVVSGGGYLDIDAEAGSYDGVIDLEVLGVGVCAVAIIDTKLPDVDGWSMFFALYLDLPSIQLGFGFTLNGVGGVAGINRAIDVDALGSAVRSGSLDTILFPEDPVADAPIIIEEFRSIFPPADGSYVFGPIVKIGWGTPTLIEAELGIIIQLPDPLVIVVLGSLSAVLPSKDLELVALNLDVAGAIDFEAGTLAIDASLHDSHVVGFALSGDMALRAEFGNAQAFLMSVGGFHPRFDPPGDFPDLRPVTFGITAGSVLRIDFMSYFALTSNSVQCGADFTLDADVMGFGVYGSCGFDALIQFSPFMVITSVDFEVSITAAGVDLMGVKLYASVEGPNRWHVIGTARFEVLGFGKDIRVDELIGSKENEPAVEAANVLAELIVALQTDDAWRVIEANDSAVTLQEIDDPDAPLMATPDSVIEVRQTLVPLGIDIEQFGNAPVGEHSTFELTAVGLEQSGTLDDWFAPGQFFELGNDDKLEGPEFELMRAGIQFGGGAPIAGEDVGVDTGYKPYIIDPEFPEEETFLGKTSIVHDLTGVSATAHTQNGFTAVHTELVGTTSPTYIVVDDGGATVASTTTWSAAYTASTGRSDLHIEREMAISA